MADDNDFDLQQVEEQLVVDSSPSSNVCPRNKQQCQPQLARQASRGISSAALTEGYYTQSQVYETTQNSALLGLCALAGDHMMPTHMHHANEVPCHMHQANFNADRYLSATNWPAPSHQSTTNRALQLSCQPGNARNPLEGTMSWSFTHDGADRNPYWVSHIPPYNGESYSTAAYPQARMNDTVPISQGQHTLHPSNVWPGSRHSYLPRLNVSQANDLPPWSDMNIREGADAHNTLAACYQPIAQKELSEASHSTGGDNSAFSYPSDNDVEASVSSFNEDIDSSNCLTSSVMTICQDRKVRNNHQFANEYNGTGIEDSQCCLTHVSICIDGCTPGPGENVDHMSERSPDGLSAPSPAITVSDSSSFLSVSSPSLSRSTDDILLCSEVGCNKEFSGPHRTGSLNRHKRNRHRVDGPRSYPCLDTSCSHIFKRQDSRLKHLRKCHPNRGIQAAVPRGRQKPANGNSTQPYATSLGRQESQEQRLQNVSSWAKTVPRQGYRD
ncbi:hypothetical protein GQ44DRAFT_767718 [Phaeosphaeriaceae sp. PMI808]|nr:hypothetical protein GQ44DRAFT_767718 [Phaeosphaeriaceae sp. PMI808]